MTTFTTLRTLIEKYEITFPENCRFEANYNGRKISGRIFNNGGYGLTLEKIENELDNAYRLSGEDLGYEYIDLVGCQGSYEALKRWGYEVAVFPYS